MTKAKFKRLKPGAKVRFNSKFRRFLFEKAYDSNVRPPPSNSLNHEGALCYVLISLGDYTAELTGSVSNIGSRPVTVSFKNFPGLVDQFWTDESELV